MSAPTVSRARGSVDPRIEFASQEKFAPWNCGPLSKIATIASQRQRRVFVLIGGSALRSAMLLMSVFGGWKSFGAGTAPQVVLE